METYKTVLKEVRVRDEVYCDCCGRKIDTEGEDYLHLENGGDIVDTASIPDMHFHSDWAIANPTVRDKVLSSRMVIIYTHETVTL